MQRTLTSLTHATWWPVPILENKLIGSRFDDYVTV